MPKGVFVRTPEHKEHHRQSATGRKLTPETIQKLREIGLRRGIATETQQQMHSWVRTPEIRRRMSEARLGKKMPPEQGQKIRDAKLGKKRAPFTAEHIHNMRESVVRHWEAFSPEERQQRLDRWNENNRQVSQGTKIENRVEQALQRLELAYLKQYWIERCRVDFYLPALNMVVEADGDYWHSLPRAIKRDKERDDILTGLGYRVVRLKESDIRCDVDTLVQHSVLDWGRYEP